MLLEKDIDAVNGELHDSFIMQDEAYARLRGDRKEGGQDEITEHRDAIEKVLQSPVS